MSLAEKDKQYIWHPYTQMKGALPHIPIVKAQGSWIYTEDGNQILDAISSWWVNVHGHAHPHVAKRIAEQAAQLEHVIFAGFTHPVGVELAERLIAKLPDNQEKVFFSDNGSTAVEVAIKMAMQYWQNKGEKKQRLVALDGAYHGDTFGAMSVSGRSAFSAPFDHYLFEVDFLPFPEGQGQATLDHLETVLKTGEVACLILEPLVQGASGMRMYSKEVLQAMVTLARKYNALVIGDEVFTGFGRTGKLLAFNHIEASADIYTFSKGITGGFMALGVTTCTQEIYDAFLSDDKFKTLFHGHSFTGNPIACAAACASMDLFDAPETWENIERICQQQQAFAEELIQSDKVEKVRREGTILAFDIITNESTSYFNSVRDNMYTWFLEKGVLLRPLGNTLYVLPPYCTTNLELNLVYAGIKAFLDQELG